MSPLFNFSTGNPSNLTAGQNASMGDIQGPFTDLRTAVNGNLDEVNVPNLAAAFSTYKLIERGGGQFGAPVAASYVLGTTASGPMNAVMPAAAGSAVAHFTWDPTLYAANARTTKLNLRVVVTTNLVAPAQSFTTSMFTVSGFAGGSGISPNLVTGSTVSGSSVAHVTPGAAVATNQNSGDFSAPGAGQYVIATVITGTAAGGTAYTVQYQLLMRQM